MNADKKSVLFDYDGVIIDSIDSVIGRWNTTARVFGNKKTIDKKFVRNRNSVVWREFYQAELGVPKDKLNEAAQIFRQNAQNDAALPIFDGMKEAILKLHQRYQLFILSSSYSEAIRNFLERHEIISYFNDIVGDDEAGGIGKTEPEFYLNPMGRWGIKPEAAIHIGDTVVEIGGAKRAGLKTIGCTWGYQDRSLLESAGPDLIADRPEQLPVLVDRLFNNSQS